MKITIKEKTLKVEEDIKFAVWLLENFSEHYKKGDTVSDMAKRVINLNVCKECNGFV